MRASHTYLTIVFKMYGSEKSRQMLVLDGKGQKGWLSAFTEQWTAGREAN